MSNYATAVESAVIEKVLTGGQRTDAAGLRVVFATIADAIRYFDNLTEGSKIRSAPGAPAPEVGKDGDLYINTTPTGRADFYTRANDTWTYALSLKGADGKTPVKGKDYFDGVTPRKGIDYSDGAAGTSAYQVALANGFVGSETQWLASLKGRTPQKDVDYFDGAPGSVIRFGEASFTDAGASGDVLFETIAATSQLRIYQSTGSAWTPLYTSPAGAAIADNSITNEKLGLDLKIGSLSAARNGFPQDQTTQASLTTVEKFFVWCGTKIQDLYTQLSQLTQLVNKFDSRITTLEQRPTSTGTGSGTGSGTANYPAQSTGTAGQFLQSTGAAGAEKWATITNNRVGWVYGFKNEISRNQRFFKTTAVVRLEKDAGISTLSYSIDGATAVNVVFTGNVFAPTANAPLSFPAGSLITWAITYNANYSDAAFELEGAES
jgi:hypothetical protein